MKALIRHPGELIRETDGIEGIDWITGAPNTNEHWCGGPYAMAEDCPPDAIAEDFDITTYQAPRQETDDEGNVTTVMETKRRAILNVVRYNQRKTAEAQT